MLSRRRHGVAEPRSPVPLQEDHLTAADYYADSYGHFGIHE